jgi:molecular chaperone GrpE (heat shock protein)
LCYRARALNVTSAAVAEAVALANKQHAIAIESAHRTYKAKLLIAQQAEQAALRELSARQEDLKQERERSLQTMRQLRESQDRRNEEENAHKMRTAEFLEEIATLRDTTEDVLAQNDALTQRVKELTTALAESVSKTQVKEMERLFIETVSRLSDRVNLLEGKQKTSGTGGSSAAPAAPGPSTVASGSAGSTREVRIEPGGRIRASNSGGGGAAGSGKYGGGAALQSMQHSQSTGTVPPAASSGGAASESNSEKRSNTGKLW